MSAIAVQNVSKHWTTASGEVRAVDSISFALEPGTLNVLLGPSGCGKSTTLRLIAGLDRADAGRVFIDGQDVTDLPPARRKIAMVFQSYALFPHLSVAENIVFGLRVRNTDEADRERRLKRVSELLGLSALLDRKPGQLSGGQQQRVALGRALIAEAPVCLLDEPLSNLDAQLRQEMRLEIRKPAAATRHHHGVRHARSGRGDVYGGQGHPPLGRADRAERRAGRPVRNAGQRLRRAVHRHAADEPAAARPRRPGGGHRGTRGPGVGPIGWAGGTLGVRPEHIVLSREGAFEVRVETVEYLGADSLLLCRIGDQLVTARVAGRVGLSGGDFARLDWAGGASHYFDAATGARRLAEPVHEAVTMLA